MLLLGLQLSHHQRVLLVLTRDGLAALLTRGRSRRVSLLVPGTPRPAQLSTGLLLGFGTGTRARSAVVRERRLTTRHMGPAIFSGAGREGLGLPEVASTGIHPFPREWR